MEILIISALSIVLIFFAFITGLHYGSKTKSNEVIKMPHPIKEIKEQIRESREEKKEQEIIDINLRNIENYDGTGAGQEDFPE